MKKTLKNSLIATSAIVGATVIIVPSVIAIIKAKQEAVYDFGVATDTLTTLNYLKYTNVGSPIQSLVEGILKTGAIDELSEALGLPRVDFNLIPLPGNKPLRELTANQKASMRQTSRHYAISEFGYTTGALAPMTDDNAKLFAIINSTSNRIAGFKAILNEGQSKWSNNEEVRAQDFIDSLHYILDLNTGSQLINRLIDLKIKNTEKIIAAQEDYIKQFKTTYINPFGRANYIWDEEKKDYIENPDFVPWTSQNSGDENYVKAIKEAVLGFGVYTGQAFEGYTNEFVSQNALLTPSYAAEHSEVIEIENPKFDHTKSESEQPGVSKKLTINLKRNRFFDWKKQNFDPKKSDLGEYMAFAQNRFQLFFELEEVAPQDVSSILSKLSRDAVLLPINRKFVETVAGGIDEFGSTVEKFLWNGPFDIEDISLGTNGYIILKKREEYYSKEKTLAKRIKIYFQKDPTITFAMFEQGYIVESTLPTISQLKSWTNPKLKPLMEKSGGFGTIGLQLNLDKKIAKQRKSYLDDVDLRVALAFAINRNDVLKLSGWDSSFPVVTWTAFGEAVTSKGFPVESYFDNQFFTTKYDVNGAPKKFPIQSYTHADHQAKSFTFEHVDRTDTGFDIDTAKAYLQAFKDKHPDLDHVTLEFISNSTIEQINAGLSIKDLIKKAFGDFVRIELKDLPINVYDEWKSKGQFDLAYGNFDFFGSSAESYVKTFFFADGVNVDEGKFTGYRLNTAGNWTYENYFKDIVGEKDEQYYKRLEIPVRFWNKIKELSFKSLGETEVEHKDRVSAFFTSTFTAEELAQGWDEDQVFKTITALEKIIRDSAPIIPLMEVDTLWKITRLGGVKSLNALSLQFAYDINKPPRPTLSRERSK